MAEKIESFTKRGRGALYPWNEWADGGIWRLTPGEDFKITPGGIKGLAYNEARRRGKRCLTGDGPDGTVEIQFVDKKGAAEPAAPAAPALPAPAVRHGVRSAVE